MVIKKCRANSSCNKKMKEMSAIHNGIVHYKVRNRASLSKNVYQPHILK